MTLLLWRSLGIIYSLSLNLPILISMFSFANLVREFLILLAILCVHFSPWKGFQADFSFAQSSVKCLISQSSYKLWKWHRRLGHMSFDLLCQLNLLGLFQGLPLLKFESNLICAPCHHGKMIAASHSPINTVMNEQPK
jgi:hypothetical protein